MKVPALEPNWHRYVASGYRRVHGWVPELALLLIARLAQFQRTLETTGPVCEIGVHHGRTLVLLHMLTQSGEMTAGVDLHARAQLLTNLRAHHADLDRVRILVADSLTLAPERILELCAGRPRLFSLDGARTAESTFHDLALAHATCCDAGVAIVDDYFKEAWPQVSEGVCRFMTGTRGLYPFAIGGNKLFLTNSREHARSYRDGLLHVFAGQTARSIMFDEPVILVGAPSWRARVARNELWRAVRDRPLGRVLRRIGNHRA
jgi:hypothetical protein